MSGNGPRAERASSSAARACPIRSAATSISFLWTARIAFAQWRIALREFVRPFSRDALLASSRLRICSEMPPKSTGGLYPYPRKRLEASRPADRLLVAGRRLDRRLGLG